MPRSAESAAWLKLKPKLTLDARVTGGSGERIARQQPFELKVGARASVVCWDVMPSGMLRHPLFLAWS
jgi:hypothetical protein